jgi:hypothetical protein
MKKTLLAALLLAALSTAGCAAGYNSYYVRTAPPPLRVEAFGPAPGPGYVWASGYWGARGGRYDWVPGRWAVPPRRNAHWVPGRWEQRGGRYYFHDGRWR